MRKFGIVLMIVGVGWGIFAFNMETSTYVSGSSYGSGMFSTYIPGRDIHNLDLADQRRNHL
ncbi:MAG: hypothetical protein WCI45_09885, partial [Desulfuromonadales bacterium]